MSFISRIFSVVGREALYPQMYYNLSLLNKEIHQSLECVADAKRKQFLKKVTNIDYLGCTHEYFQLPNRKKDGLCMSWYGNKSDKNRLTECTYCNGEMNGLFRGWYSNGNIAIECTYLNDKKEGLYRSWLPNSGMIESECMYHDDKRID